LHASTTTAAALLDLLEPDALVVVFFAFLVVFFADVFDAVFRFAAAMIDAGNGKQRL